MTRSALLLVRLLVVAGLIGGPVAYAFHHLGQARNFRPVREGVLYRSAQTTLAGLGRLIHDYGIRTVVSLRDSYTGGPPPDAREEEYCRKRDILYVRIPPRAWEAAEGPAPVEQGVRRFLEVMADPSNYPVLIHCCAGIHRTGAYCAIYRMEFEGWSNAQAIAEVKDLGYANFDVEWDIRRYLENYRPGLRVKIHSPHPTSR
jgi:protein tyrosine/serine phosphatase